jgi:hypothetical protein
LAGSAGLGAEEIRQLHGKFFASVEALALGDGVVSDVEAKNLEKIKKELGI